VNSDTRIEDVPEEYRKLVGIDSNREQKPIYQPMKNHVHGFPVDHTHELWKEAFETA